MGNHVKRRGPSVPIRVPRVPDAVNLEHCPVKTHYKTVARFLDNRHRNVILEVRSESLSDDLPSLFSLCEQPLSTLLASALYFRSRCLRSSACLRLLIQAL